MKYLVVKLFKDKHTKITYKPGETYETEDKKRAAFLQDLGFIAEQKEETLSDERPQDLSVLDVSIDELTKNIEGITDVSELERLLEVERAEKKRKGAIAAIERRIAVCKE